MSSVEYELYAKYLEVYGRCAVGDHGHFGVDRGVVATFSQWLGRGGLVGSVVGESIVGLSGCTCMLSGTSVSGVGGGVVDGLCDSDGVASPVAGGDVAVCNEPVKLGPNGGVSVGRGPNYERNLAARLKKKQVGSRQRRLRFGVYAEGLSSDSSGSSSVDGVGNSVGLRSSLEAKWVAENELAVEQAKRKLALLKSRDLEAEKKMQRAQIMRTTESAKVQTERAYATLRRTGNVPGFVETVVTDGSCPASSLNRSDGTCISPDSSVSQQEIRAMMKELEDCKLTLKRIERDNPALVAHHMEGHGVKTAFTLDSDGLCPVDEPGSMGSDGKYHLDSYEPNPRFYKDRFRAEEFAEKYFGS